MAKDKQALITVRNITAPELQSGLKNTINGLVAGGRLAVAYAVLYLGFNRFCQTVEKRTVAQRMVKDAVGATKARAMFFRLWGAIDKAERLYCKGDAKSVVATILINAKEGEYPVGHPMAGEKYTAMANAVDTLITRWDQDGHHTVLDLSQLVITDTGDTKKKPTEARPAKPALAKLESLVLRVQEGAPDEDVSEMRSTIVTAAIKAMPEDDKVENIKAAIHLLNSVDAAKTVVEYASNYAKSLVAHAKEGKADKRKAGKEQAQRAAA